jgi:NADH:ubiquinone oxidoreductase subunit 2 (subunit N)
MKILSFYYNENYKYILIVAIILILTSIYDDYIINDKYFNNEEFNFLSTIFNYIGQFLTIFIYYKYKEKNEVNSTEIINYILFSIDRFLSYVI